MPAQEPTRCIVLAPPRSANGAVQRPQLDQRHWDTAEFHDAALAMAELVLAERAEAARSAWGLQRKTHIVMAIDEPAACGETPALLAAIARYLPGVAVWDCSGGQLKPIALPQCAAASPAAEIVDAENSSEADDSATISREELDMLLEMGGGQ